MQQLAALERAQDKLREEEIRVVAASVDPLEKAREAVEKQLLTYPEGLGLPVKETAPRRSAPSTKSGVVFVTPLASW